MDDFNKAIVKIHRRHVLKDLFELLVVVLGVGVLFYFLSGVAS